MLKLALNENELVVIGRDLLCARRWRDAASVAATFLDRHPSSVSANALSALAGLFLGNAESPSAIRDIASDNPGTPFALEALGILYLAESKLTDAEYIFQQAQKLAPEDPEIACRIAGLKLVQGDFPAAEAALQPQLDQGKARSSALGILGSLRLHQHNLAGAEAIAAKMIELDPQDATAWLLLATIAKEMSEPKAALECLDRAAVISPDDSLISIARLDAMLAHALTREGHERHSLLACTNRATQRALLLQPNQPLLHLIHARSLRFSGCFQEAATILGELIRASPDAAERYVELSHVHLEGGNPEGALVAANAAVRLSPQSPEVWAMKMRVLCSLGRPGGVAEAQAAVYRVMQPAEVSPELVPRSSAIEVSLSRIFDEYDIQSALFLARYLAPARECGAHIRLRLPAYAVELFGHFPEIDVSAIDDTPVPEDHLPLCLLPSLLGVSDAEPCWTGPYIPVTNAQTVHGIPPGYAAAGRLRVGFSLGDCRDFSLLEEIREILKDMDDLEIIVFGISPSTAIWGPLNFETVPLPDLLAARDQITKMDALVILESPLAHLAGAMGLSANILLPEMCHPIWGSGQQKCTPWYPTLKLLHSIRGKGWGSAVKDLAGFLSAIRERG